ncbi:MAG: XRE family transcriptional regulator [Bacteroidota bacterium]
MKDYLIGIGRRIKEIRKKGNHTISEIAHRAEVTSGLISRIENGRTIPSLPVFLKIIDSLDIEVTEFFKGVSQVNASGYIVSRKEENDLIEKEDEAVGFTYSHIFGKQLSSVGFDAVLLTIAPGSQREKVITDAYEFKYVLSGECHYTIGQDEIPLKEGDSIFFDGRIPHVPANKQKTPLVILVIYFFITS